MKNMKLKNRILIPFLILNLLVLSISFVILFEDITIKKNEAFEAKNINITEVSTSHLYDKLLTLKNTQSMIINDSEVYNIIQSASETLTKKEQFELEKHLQKYNMTKDIYNIRVFLNSTPQKQSSKIFNIKDFDKLVKPLNGANDMKMFWVPTYRLKHNLIINTQYVISFVRPIFISGEFKGYIVMDMLEKSVFDVLANLGSFKHEKPQIITSDGMIISSFDKYKISTFSEKFIRIKNNLDNKQENRMYSHDTSATSTYINKIGDVDWYLMIDFDKNEVKIQNEQLRNLMITLYLVSTLVVIVISQKIASMVTDRINQLNSVTQSFINNGFSDYEAIDITYSDEVGALQKSINILMENIDLLVNERFESELALKDAELRVLQAQINPHFLYNILDMINWMALDQEAYDISKATSTLAKFFRLSLAGGSEEITLEQELEHVKLYLDIQNMRYKNAIKYTFDIDENILDYYTLKLILQPLVENAIIHGINEKKLPEGEITIQAYEDFDCIIIEISDNGVGMSASKAKELNNADNEKGFGVKNINERIQIKYGMSFGLKYKSAQGEGTIVTIKLPLIKK